jgi:hypothetical protein
MTIKSTILFLAGLMSWLMIGMSGQMIKSTEPRTYGDITYAILLILSVIFLHWALRSFLIPINRVPDLHVPKLRAAVEKKYTKGFFAGVVGIGYLLLALHVFALLDRSVTIRPSHLHLALFFIALGVLAQARAASEYLCNALDKE